MKDRPVNIGSILYRQDGRFKITGEAKFATDFYGENFVWAGVKRAGIPCAIIKNLDCTEALSLPGVICILTYRDIRGTNRQGVVRKDQPVLVEDRINHCGDAVALVLAETRTAMETAIDSINIETEPLPPLISPESACNEDSPLVHEENASGNILLGSRITVGKGKNAESECSAIIEATFETQRQEHAYLETENGWARLDNTGKIEIVCSTQTPFRDRAEVAEALGLDPKNIRIIVAHVGGAFGGKDGITVQSLLGLAALHSEGRPVKMWWSREESFVASVKRHPSILKYRLGSKANGDLHYLDVDITLDTGPYDHLGGVVLALAMEHSGGPYRIPNGIINGRCVYTNNPVSGAFRGFGVTQASSGIERAIDILADRIEMDPLELRIRNALKPGDINFVGKTLTSSTGISECLETLSKNPLWTNRSSWKKDCGFHKKRGVGISAVAHASGYGPVVPDYANAKIELTDDGKFRVYCGVVDMGQGNSTANVQIICSVLNQIPDNIELVLPDTAQTLPSCSASASRCTYTFGNALISAAKIMKDRLCQKAADLMMKKDPGSFAIVRNVMRHLPTGSETPLNFIAGLMNASEKVVTAYFRAPVAEDMVTEDINLRLHGMPHNLYSYAANLAAVELDEITGKVTIANYATVSDCGNVLNPQAYEQQIQGGAIQGIGLALYEDFESVEGRITTADFSTYLVPTSMDAPDVDSVALGICESTGPFGSKGIGEIGINGPLPAIANALFDATGHVFKKSPITPEMVLNACGEFFWE